ncbi:MAG: cell wall hydrolase [Alphaproteobacteria bacterium]|nr:cell wall hydrolase [Alphaproteobacteria bacterium]
MTIIEHDLDILARTLYGEGRGEYNKPDGGLAALIAIGNVIMNRVKTGGWFGRSIAEVCQKPWQFSCWNQGDPNLMVIQNISKYDPIFKICRQVAIAVANYKWPDITKGCDHYFSRILAKEPKWAQGRYPKFCLGLHQFYQLGI